MCELSQAINSDAFVLIALMLVASPLLLFVMGITISLTMKFIDGDFKGPKNAN